MGLFTTPVKSLDDLFVHTLQDMYYAEQQIVAALPKMSEYAASAELKAAFDHHLEQTKNHVRRLEDVFRMHGHDPKTTKCEAVNGIIAEAKEVMSDAEEGPVLDAAMVSAAQAVEHYEISRYGSLVAMAKQLQRQDCARALEETLAEEKAADAKLTSIAEAGVNRAAA